MENYLSILLFGGVAFMTIVMFLAAKPKPAMYLAGICAVTAAVGGLLLYGYGFITTIGDTTLAVIRTIFAVCRMFIGEAEYESVCDVPPFGNGWVDALFWILHLLAVYATATAAISAIGAEALRKLRVWLVRWGELNLIYGANSDSLEFARALQEKNHGIAVFIDEAPELSDPEEISACGCVLRTDTHAVLADRKLLKSLGIRRGSRKINLYALKKDPSDNLLYAKRFLKSLEESGIASEQTRLVIHARDNSSASTLQVQSDRYGYGFVHVFREASLAARLLVRTYPPCEAISFDSEGRACEDFDALIIGFGQLGQAVLKSLVMNGQFAGSRFHAAVFSPDCQSVNGYFSSSLKQVIDHYDISFHPYDARSMQMYEYLAQRGRGLKYVAVCTGSGKLNQEISEELGDFFQDIGICLPIYQCTYQGIRLYDAQLEHTRMHSLYDPDLLSMQVLDAQAMLINHYYRNDPTGDPLDNWMKCDYFSRMSCRASADFMPAALRAAGKSREQVLAGDWQLSETMLRNLSETEHMRWCAFHFCMGYSPMSAEEYDAREAEYLRQRATGEKPSIRVGKNTSGRTHACLVEWDELDALSARETAVTGIPTDYKDKDAENIRIVPELLKTRSNPQ